MIGSDVSGGITNGDQIPGGIVRIADRIPQRIAHADQAPGQVVLIGSDEPQWIADAHKPVRRVVEVRHNSAVWITDAGHLIGRRVGRDVGSVALVDIRHQQPGCVVGVGDSPLEGVTLGRQQPPTVIGENGRVGVGIGPRQKVAASIPRERFRAAIRAGDCGGIPEPVVGVGRHLTARPSHRLRQSIGEIGGCRPVAQRIHHVGDTVAGIILVMGRVAQGT